MTPRSPDTRRHHPLFAFCTALLVACGSSSTDDGGTAGAGGGGSGGMSGTGGSTSPGTGGGGSPGSGGSGAAGTGGSSDHCGGDLSSTDANAYAAKFKLTDNQISGWKQAPGKSTFEVLTAEKLDCKIDGAAPDYVEHGLRWAMYQDLVGPNDQVCRLVAMDFGTAANATSMVQAQKELMGANIEIPPYDAGTAIASEVIGGVSVYAHFGSSYFEVQLNGFSDQGSATQAAATFLGVLKPKASP
jgi:hypothetical protein